MTNAQATPASLRSATRTANRGLVACFAVMFASAVAAATFRAATGPSMVLVFPSIVAWMLALALVVLLTVARRTFAAHLTQMEPS